MIKSFSDKETKKIFKRNYSKRIPEHIQESAYRKLVLIDSAIELNDLRVLPGNELEKLKGDRKGQYSIRINDQWRICFFWGESDAYEVEIIDYH